MAKNSDKQPVVPYVPFDTFISMLEHLNTTVVPPRLDKSALPTNMASLVKGQVQSAMRFLRLIDANDTVLPALKDLAKNHGTTEWEDRVIEHLFPAYEEVIGDLDTDHATQQQLDERFQAVGVSGQMLLKAVRFYLAMLTSAGCTYSPHFARKRRSSPTTKKKTGKKKSRKQSTKKKTLKPKGEEKHEQQADDMLLEGFQRLPVPLGGGREGAIFYPDDLQEDECEKYDAAIVYLRALVK